MTAPTAAVALIIIVLVLALAATLGRIVGLLTGGVS